MYHFTPAGINFKVFVKEKYSDSLPDKFNTNGHYCPASSLTGDEAKEFYEEVLKNSSLKKERKQNQKPKEDSRLPPKPVHSKMFKRTDILWMAQNNDVKNMRIYFAQNKDNINIVDEFGWTPLMCASYSGAENAVLLLLENGADPHQTNKSGETALGLAQRKNHYKIVKILEEQKLKPDIAENLEVTESLHSNIFFCPTCKETFDMDKNKHESSTVHLFNCPRRMYTYYGIPESNKGFQILLREGWNKEKGLGRDESGRKFPVKAIIKKDRMGIGATDSIISVKRQSQYLNESKKKIINKKWREKDFEKNFRLEFS